MQIARPKKSLTIISLVPLVDVMLILLVFFMVTSTYLDLDMIPVAERSDDGLQESGEPSDGETRRPLLIRLSGDGTPVLHGKPVTLGSLALQVKARKSEAQTLPVTILPSRSASLQSLVSLMETVNDAGATSVRIIRLEAAQP